jgi:hypothetical protein
MGDIIIKYIDSTTILDEDIAMQLVEIIILFDDE